MLLVIGNKRYSSWSLRPWLLLKHFAIPFEEKLIPLDQEQTREQILKYSPSGKVPALVDKGVTIWESMAIAEYLNEKYPEKKMWPARPQDRAWARSISNEMHAGFQTMRNHMQHDIKKRLTNFDWSVAKEDVERVKEIWMQCLHEFKGPYLFGNFSIADAMYAPVVNRFVTYDIPLEPEIRAYV
ncbi:MAG: glutathione S-transferase family protein, partial [Bdellovibrionales bacterium]